jgi:hypothetical protein
VRYVCGMRVKICACRHNLASTSLRSLRVCPHGQGGASTPPEGIKRKNIPIMYEVNKEKRAEREPTIVEEVQVKKDMVMKFRVSYFEKIAIEEKAANAGLKVSDYIRRAALVKHIPSLMTAEQVEAYKILKNLEVNFKRIGNMYHDKNLRNYEALSREVAAVVKQVQEHLNAVKNGQ